MVVQILSAGAERWRALWGPALAKLCDARAVFERSDVEVRTLEGLQPRVGSLLGEPPGTVRMQEDGIAYELEAAGVPKSDIVLAFHSEEVRPHTGYAVA